MALGKIEIIRSDTYSFNINFKDSSEVAIDITGYEIWFTVREKVPRTSTSDDTDALISKTYTTGGVTGVVPISLTSDDTDLKPKSYVYDIQYKKPDGNVKSTGVLEFVILDDVTRDL